MTSIAASTSSHPRRSELVLLAAALAWAGGFAHAMAAVDHFGHYWLYGVFFGVVSAAQLTWGALVYRAPTAKLLKLGLAGSLGLVLLWLATRTIGPPIGPERWDAERVGGLDAAATATELLTAWLAYLLLSTHGHVVQSRGAVIARALTYPALAGALVAAFLFGGHQH